jgi:hypothetical protein
MHGDAPTSRTVADRLTERVSALDHGTNAVHDALNRAVPSLWWPLAVPSAANRLTAREHALYAVHAGIGITAACLVGSRRGRIVAVGGAAALASWALFTGAWDRRADQIDS